MRKYIYLFLFIVLPLLTIGQNRSLDKATFTIKGKVIDASTGETLPYVNVITEAKLKTQSNTDGYFVIPDMQQDSLVIRISYVGYKTKEIVISKKNAQNEMDILIALESNNTLNEVSVYGEKINTLKVDGSVSLIKITPQTIKQLPIIGEKDVFRVFQLIPGVSASNESSSGLYIRGGTPDQTLVSFDGFTIYHVDHLYGFFSTFNYNAIKDIQLYRGGFEAKYGGRISGVADVRSKDGNSKTFNSGVDLGLLSSNIFLEGPLGQKSSFLITGRRSWQSPLYNKILKQFVSDNSLGGSSSGTVSSNGTVTPDNTILSKINARAYFYDLNGKYTYRPTSNDIISLSIFNSFDKMNNSISETSDDFEKLTGVTLNEKFSTKITDITHWGNLGSSFKWSKRWSKTLYSHILTSYSAYTSTKNNANEFLFTQSDSTQRTFFSDYERNTIKDFSTKIDFEWSPFITHKVAFGSILTQYNVLYNYIQNDTLTVVNRNDLGNLYTFYLQDNWHKGAFDLNIGTRFNYYSITNKYYPEPRASFQYFLNKNLKIKGAAGIYYQFLKQVNREDLLQGNRNFWILSNSETLPVTKSIHQIIGVGYNLKKILFDIEFYRKLNTGITEYSLRFVPAINENIELQELFFNGNETVSGVDVLLQKHIGKFSGWLGYTYATAVRNISTLSANSYYSDQDVRHQFKAVFMYQTKKIDLSATWIYSTGRPYTSILGTYDITLLNGSTKTFTMPSDKNTNRFTPYHRADISGTYHINDSFSITASIFNLYNRQNIWYKKFQQLPFLSNDKLQIIDVNYMSITPNILLSWQLK